MKKTGQSKILGRFTFVLHSHLPYVLSHGRWPHGMVWLAEAASETYIPLWRLIKSLSEKKKKIALTIGISPVLAEQLKDRTFVREFNEYLDLKQKAAETDIISFEKQSNERLAKVARYWLEFYQRIEEDFRGPLAEDIISGFAALQDEGAIEIITCGATHGYLPLLGTDEAVNAQIKLGVDSYRRHFGRDPQGIWLPECAYRPGYYWISPSEPESDGFERIGIEKFLQKYGLRYFIVDSHLLKGGRAVGTYLARFEGLQRLWEQANKETREYTFAEDKDKVPYQVYWIDGTVGDGDPVGILTRDPTTSLQVWSGEWGYPGDGWYLDFHKKHFPGGHRYWRVTRTKADLGEKEEYELEKIEQRLEENSDHFVSLIHDVLGAHESIAFENRMVVSPFDTELFGHWWFEGTRWLEKVLTKVDQAPNVEAAHGIDLIESTDEAPVVALPEGSWGEGGFHYIWFNEDTKWTWLLVHRAEREMTSMARRFSQEDGRVKEILAQMGRELLLLESSDWQFLISTVAAKDYAELRVRQHHLDFEFLRDVLLKVAEGEDMTNEERERYEAICARDVIFADLDPSVWT